MKFAIKNNFVLIAIAISLFRCGQAESPVEHGHQENHDAHEGHEAEEAHNENVVALTAIQLANADLQYGSLDTLNISGFVNASGVLDLPPQNIAAISAPMDGFVKKANHLVGDYVKKGTILAVMEHMDYIKLQEEYINVLNNLNYLELEYERQMKLDSAQISSNKQFQAAKMEYDNAMARKKSLAKQLQYLGLSPARVAQGNISSTISVRAPFNGYITALNVHNGSFAKSELEMYEMVDTDHMHLELNIFEQDINKIEIGQQISFRIPSTGEQKYRGKVFLVGKSFDQKTKTVNVHGHIEGDHDNFIRGLFVEARIYTGNQQVKALPEEAVVEDAGKSYVFIRMPDTPRSAVEKQHQEGEAHGHEHHEEAVTLFQRVQVITGERDQGFVEIKSVSDIPSSAKIVTKGAYHLIAEMKKGEGGHHH